ncbi:MAG: YegS/Rv2252/BmrU family lipid kinase [Clostridia bacterium]|nr:YegS/Rv2252/BmrU family lipid kinase [Clostridia bacterium]
MDNDKKKVLLVVNPCSGKTKSRASVEDIIDKFSDDDYEFSVHNTTCQGDATNIVKRELEDHDLVVCCGGDGTLNETINGVMNMPRRVPIGYVPAGTTNDLARTLGIPTELENATELIKSGQVNDYDIGLFNNRCFCYIASFGAFSASSYTTPQKLKNIFGHKAYVVKGFLETKDIHPTKMRIEFDDGVLEDEFIFGTVSNSTSVGGFFKFREEDIKLNDGYFEVLLVKKIPFYKYIPAIRKVQKYQYDGKEIIFFKTKKLKIHSPDECVKWTVDGEFAGAHHNVMIHVLERAIDICSPENHLFIKHEPKIIDPVEAAAEKYGKPEKKRREKRAAKKAEKKKAEKKKAENATEEAIADDADAPVVEAENE